MASRSLLTALALAMALGALTPACVLDSSPYSAAGTGAGGPGGPGGGAGGPGGHAGSAGDGGAPGGAGGAGAATTTGGTGATGGDTTGGTAGTGGSGGDTTGDACPGKPVTLNVYSEVILANGDTTAASNDAGSSCGGGMGPDLVYQVTPQESGYLVATLEPSAPFKGFLHIRGACQDPNSELGCGKGSVSVPVQKGSPVYVFVDGQTPQPSGKFNLTLFLDGCGNGILEKEHEECDDGNIQFLDGCDATCQVECDCPDVATDCLTKEGSTHHCYALVRGPDADWDTANIECQLWGGTLAVLATTDEIGEVDSLVEQSSGDPWIGANDLVTEGSFAWVNGEPFTYKNGDPPWKDHFAAPNEPNGGTGENCVEVYKDSTLNDENCTDAHDYLCERPPAGETPADQP